MTLNFKYVVYESCQFDDLAIKKCEQHFLLKTLKCLRFFIKKSLLYSFFDTYKSKRLILIVLHFFKKSVIPVHFSVKTDGIGLIFKVYSELRVLASQ